MVAIVAVALTIVAVQLKPAQDANIRIDKMLSILKSVNVPVENIDKANVQQEFESKIVAAVGVDIEGKVVSNDFNKVFSTELGNELKKPAKDQVLPVFKALNDNKDTLYIFQLYGKGLWGPIWGYIALNPDFNSVYGTTFDHKGETPGLGAEINEKWFQEEFVGKEIFDNQTLVSIKLMKGGVSKDNKHAVDAISGGTITSKGLEKMMLDCLQDYKAFIEANRK